MAYLARSAHRQFLGLVFGLVGWLVTACISGVNDWRIWYVDDQSIISGGVAWVGVWRACFNTHVLDTSEFCRSISITDSFTPLEIAAAQVLCMVAIGVGVIANLVAGYAVRNAYFGVDCRHVRLTFVMAGFLYFLTASCSLVPVFWNMNSVLANLTIDFPSDFHLPPAPATQAVGPGIGIGIGSSLMLVISGLLFVCYRYPTKTTALGQRKSGAVEQLGNINLRVEDFVGADKESKDEGRVNPAFEANENLYL